jgi:molybdenum cofactor synthesis domain-containing protein
MRVKIALLTVSDRCSRGERQDLSGLAIQETLTPEVFEIRGQEVVPDERERITAAICRFADELGCDIVLTTGGTGLGPRDVTPEATASVCDRMVPGLPELMRAEGLKSTRNAALSRAVAGMRGKTLIVNLPGSPRAVRECLGSILDVLPHAVDMAQGGGHG